MYIYIYIYHNCCLIIGFVTCSFGQNQIIYQSFSESKQAIYYARN